MIQELVVGNPSIPPTSCIQFQNSASRYLLDPATRPCQYPTNVSCKVLNLTKNKLEIGKKVDSLSKEHVGDIAVPVKSLGPKVSETLKTRLSLGARILQAGGVEKFFRQYFRVTEEENLLKASHCYLSTTSGPLAGLLFISTEKVAFCSERSIKVFNQKGQMCRIRYKVAIPLKKIKCVNQSQHVHKPSQKYIKIDTVDNFDFWFMGVLHYQKTFRYLEQAISQTPLEHKEPRTTTEIQEMIKRQVII